MIDTQQMARYREGARRRLAQRQERIEARRARARSVAERAAQLLKRDFGVTRVVLFGSLLRDAVYSPHSDIDLAVWGLSDRLYYRVVSKLLDLDPSIPIDLLRGEDMPPHLIQAVESEGVAL